jgi:hypothetical protein
MCDVRASISTRPKDVIAGRPNIAKALSRTDGALFIYPEKKDVAARIPKGYINRTFPFLKHVPNENDVFLTVALRSLLLPNISPRSSFFLTNTSLSTSPARTHVECIARTQRDTLVFLRNEKL